MRVRRGIIFGLIISLASGGLLVIPMTSWALTLTPGDIIKGSRADLYFYGYDDKRHTFTSTPAYQTWFTPSTPIKTITEAELQAIKIGVNMTYRPGTRLIKIASDPRVYTIEPGGVLRTIKSEATARAIYGADWMKLVDTIEDFFFPDYTIGADLTGSTPPSGTLLRVGTASEIYYVENGVARKFSSLEAFTANGFQTQHIRTTTPEIFATMAQGALISGKDISLTSYPPIKTSNAVTAPATALTAEPAKSIETPKTPPPTSVESIPQATTSSITPGPTSKDFRIHYVKIGAIGTKTKHDAWRFETVASAPYKTITLTITSTENGKRTIVKTITAQGGKTNTKGTLTLNGSIKPGIVYEYQVTATARTGGKQSIALGTFGVLAPRSIPAHSAVSDVKQKSGKGVAVVSLGEQRSATTIYTGTHAVPVLTIQIKNTGSGPLTITDLQLESSLGTTDGALKDLSILHRSATLARAQSAGSIILTKPLTIPAGVTEDLAITVTPTGKGVGSSGVLTLTGLRYATSDQASILLPISLSSAALTISASEGKVGSVKISALPISTATASPSSVDTISARFRLSELTGIEDVRLQSLTVKNIGTTKDSDITQLTLKDGSGSTLATAKILEGKATFFLTSPLIIEHDGQRDLVVLASVGSGVVTGTLSLIIATPEDIQLSGATTLAGLTPTTVAPTSFPIGDGIGESTLNSVKIDPSTTPAPARPDQIMPSATESGSTPPTTAATTALTTTKLIITPINESAVSQKIMHSGELATILSWSTTSAGDEVAILSGATLSLAGASQNISSVALFDGGTQLASTPVSQGQAKFTGLSLALPRGASDTKTLTVKATAAPSADLKFGSSVQITLNDLTYQGATTGGTGTANPTSAITSVPVIVHAVQPTIASNGNISKGFQSPNATYTLGAFDVAASGQAPLQLHSLTVKTFGSYSPTSLGGGLQNWQIWQNGQRISATAQLVDANGSVVVDQLNANQSVDSGAYVRFSFGQNPLIVTAGTTTTLSVIADTTRAKAGASGAVTAGVIIEGVAGRGRYLGGGRGALLTETLGGLEWDYRTTDGKYGSSLLAMPLHPLDVTASYPVFGPTHIF